MPTNDYECEVHGVREISYVQTPPRFCKDCGNELTWVVAKNQFHIGGEDAWLNESERRSVATQLGVYPESKEHLRQIEKAKGVQRTTKTDLKRSDSVRW